MGKAAAPARTRRSKSAAAADEAPSAAAAAAASKPSKPSTKRPAAAAAEPAAADAQQPKRTRKPAAASKSGASKAAAGGAKAKKATGAGGAAAGDKPKPPYYLVKSEPDEFSWDMLQARPQQTEGWEGVRNYVARNHLRSMRLGDQAFFYHSSCKTPGIVGIVEVVREAYPDLTAQDRGSKYYDPKATADDPRWSMVDLKLVRQLRRPITLEELKGHKAAGQPLSSMALFTTARLSVQPVSKAEWEFVLQLAEQDKPE